MSVDALKEFGKKCIEDEGMKKKAKEIGIENLSGIISYAKENGYDISEEDFQKLAQEVQGSGELSEDDLEKVAGGFVSATAAVLGGVVIAGSAAAGAAVGGLAVGGVAAGATIASGGW